jgi:uncharacterized protein (TIGR02246 family)
MIRVCGSFLAIPFMEISFPALTANREAVVNLIYRFSAHGEFEVKIRFYVKSVRVASALLTAVVFMIPAISSAASMTSDETAVRNVLTSYQDALNGSSTAAAMSLYTEDGVVMPPYNESVVGKAQLSSLYEAGSKLFTLHVKFTIREVVQMSPEWAFARTHSEGTRKDIATGAMTDEANQELFILRKGADRAWRIARYSFSSTNPHQH